MNHNQVVGSLLTVLNNGSVIPKPYSNYTGSLFFGPNQEITFRNNSPKGRVTTGTSFLNEFSFGVPPRRSKHFNIHIDFFSPEGVVDDQGNKNHELVARYLDLIESGLLSSLGSYGSIVVEEIRDEDEPQRVISAEQNVWYGRKLFVFEQRQA